jgi:hypothetical protein
MVLAGIWRRIPGSPGQPCRSARSDGAGSPSPGSERGVRGADPISSAAAIRPIRYGGDAGVVTSCYIFVFSGVFTGRTRGV